MPDKLKIEVADIAERLDSLSSQVSFNRNVDIAILIIGLFSLGFTVYRWTM